MQQKFNSLALFNIKVNNKRLNIWKCPVWVTANMEMCVILKRIRASTLARFAAHTRPSMESHDPTCQKENKPVRYTQCQLNPQQRSHLQQKFEKRIIRGLSSVCNHCVSVSCFPFMYCCQATSIWRCRSDGLFLKFCHSESQTGLFLTIDV